MRRIAWSAASRSAPAPAGVGRATSQSIPLSGPRKPEVIGLVWTAVAHEPPSRIIAEGGKKLRQILGDDFVVALWMRVDLRKEPGHIWRTGQVPVRAVGRHREGTGQGRGHGRTRRD